MSMTDRRTIILVAGAIASMGLLGFALGLRQTQKPSADQGSAPVAVQGRLMNLDDVPHAEALDASAANTIIDPSAQKQRARKLDVDNEAADGPDDEPAAAAPAPAQSAATQPAPQPSAPANTAPHGPF